MEKQTPLIAKLLSLLLFLSMIIITAEGTKKSAYGIYDDHLKLFVFGDSYVDTGNYFTSPSYKPPYGITFPGKSSGRFSDGRVLTDYIASFLGIKSPAPYSLRNSSVLHYGINFAYGGSGVFHTLIDGPNMTIQIDSFEKLIQQNVYTKQDLESSVVLVSAAGNDYLKFFVTHGRSTKDVPEFTTSLMNQLSINVRNSNNFLHYAENSTLMNPLEPCCVGVSSAYFCGSVDEKGAKKYSVCDKPELSFFWNNFHPSQNGWYAVYKMLQTSLPQLEE